MDSASYGRLHRPRRTCAGSAKSGPRLFSHAAGSWELTAPTLLINRRFYAPASILLVLLLVLIQARGLQAFEAHVVNITAEIHLINPPIAVPPDSAGPFEEPFFITLTAEDPDDGPLSIHYTLDDSDPDCDSQPYTAPFEISEDTMLQALACDAQDHPSKVIEEDYGFAVQGQGLPGSELLIEDPLGGAEEGIVLTPECADPELVDSVADEAIPPEASLESDEVTQPQDCLEPTEAPAEPAVEESEVPAEQPLDAVPDRIEVVQDRVEQVVERVEDVQAKLEERVEDIGQNIPEPPDPLQPPEPASMPDLPDVPAIRDVF